MPGVVAVYTGADLVAAGVQPIPGPAGFKRPDGSDATSAPRRALAHGRVRFVGEPVVAVVADSPAAARAAADAVEVDYAELPAVVNPFVAMQPGAPVLCEQAPENIAAEMRHGDAAATAAAFARAAHTIALAGEIHSYLRDHYVIGQEAKVRDARLVLVDAARRLLTTGLALLGIPAPERM